MTEPADKPHHPLPEDGRARHDRLPESVENAREDGDDDPEAPAPSPTESPDGRYRNPDGTVYEA